MIYINHPIQKLSNPCHMLTNCGKILNRGLVKVLIICLFNTMGVINGFCEQDMMNYKLQVAARALVIKNKELLLVSNDGDFWYTAGGRMNANETLPECVVREVKEETGIDVEARELLSVFDFFDKKDGIHKVEIYFTTKIKSSVLPNTWSDQDGPVKFIKFFSFEELKEMKNVAPSFLKEGKWQENSLLKTYEGFEIKYE